MYRYFKHLNRIHNRLIVCLKLKLQDFFAGQIFFQASLLGGGTPPAAVASFFSRSPEARYSFTKKNCAFLNWNAGIGNGNGFKR